MKKENGNLAFNTKKKLSAEKEAKLKRH